MTARKKLDLNQLAISIVAQATGEAPKTKMATPKQIAGRKGGLKGGKARMGALTDEQRTALALKGVAGRKKAPANQTGAPVKK
jgi:hypothetical protein